MPTDDFSLIGYRTLPAPDPAFRYRGRPIRSGTRAPVLVRPDVRARLARLLGDERIGLSYSTFINRACEVAERQLAADDARQRQDARRRVRVRMGMEDGRIECGRPADTSPDFTSGDWSTEEACQPVRQQVYPRFSDDITFAHGATELLGRNIAAAENGANQVPTRAEYLRAQRQRTGGFHEPLAQRRFPLEEGNTNAEYIDDALQRFGGPRD